MSKPPETEQEVTAVLINTTLPMRAHAATVGQAQGTGVSAARTRLVPAPQYVVSLPFSAAVGTDVFVMKNVVITDNAGIRSWSPPV
jgi:hypothetical protein